METEKYQWVKTDGLLDVVNGVNLWIWDQTTPTPGYTAEVGKTACTRPFLAGVRLHSDGSALQVAKVRDIIGPEVEMMAAAYLKNSGPCADWCDVEGFDTILDEAITLCESAGTAPPPPHLDADGACLGVQTIRASWWGCISSREVS